MAVSLEALRRRLMSPYQEQLQDLSQQERENQFGIDRLRADTQLGNQRDESDYARSIFDLGVRRDDDLTSLGETMADRGILRSGATLVGKDRLGTEYAKNTDALARRLSMSKEDRARRLQQAQEDQQRRLGDINVNRARISSQQEQQQAIDEAEAAANAAEAAAEQQRAAQELAAAQPQLSPTGQYLPPDPDRELGAAPGGGPVAPEPTGSWEDWEAQNARKSEWGAMPEWKRMGFPNEESWRAVYRRMGG